MPLHIQKDLTNDLVNWHATHPSRAVHSTSGWLLRRWGRNAEVEQVAQTPLDFDPTLNRQWFVIRIDPKPPTEDNGLQEQQDISLTVSSSRPIFLTMIVCRQRSHLGSLAVNWNAKRTRHNM